MPRKARLVRLRCGMPPTQESMLRAAFGVFDADGSGALSVEELRAVLTRPTAARRPSGSAGPLALSDEEIEALITEFDEEYAHRISNPGLARSQAAAL